MNQPGRALKKVRHPERICVMKKVSTFLYSACFTCTLFTALCFALTSAVYLSWLDHLLALTGSPAADWLSMVAGYLMQAAGMGCAFLLLRKYPGGEKRRIFGGVSLLFAAMSVPALLTDSAAGVICFGLVINLLCGVIAGFYLFVISVRVEKDFRGRVFGGGYAVATIAVGFFALIGKGSVIHSGLSLLLYLPLTAVMILSSSLLNTSGEGTPAAKKESASAKDTGSGALIVLAAAVIFLLSAVKNLGFNFPSADIEAGLIPELSRLPYAAGLLAAGIITDKSRKNGMICTLAALIIPFIMLGLISEPIPSTVLWGLDYLFFGFFSVYRAVLFLDLADTEGRAYLSPLGLLTGRLGDAAGTAAGLLLIDHRVALIAFSVIAFFPTVFLFFRLYQKLYEPAAAVQQHTEKEVFDAFCLHNDLSAREREVLRLVLDSRSNGEIAEALFITESTVKYHVRNLLQKTGCKNRVELQRKYTLALYPHLDSEESAGY